MSAQVWVEFAQGRYRLCGTGRAVGSSWREAHLYATRGEADAACEAALRLAAERLPQASAAALPASFARRGDPALDAMRDASGRLVGTAGLMTPAVPTPQPPVGAVPRAAHAAMAGHLSTGGSTSEQEWRGPPLRQAATTR